MTRRMQIALGTTMSAALMTTAIATAGDPVLSADYGWEDEVGTILGSFGAVSNPVNVGAEGDVTPNSGARMLRVSEAPHSGTPQAYVAYIENLQDGDIVTARFWVWDDTPGDSSAGYPSVRIWGHYAQTGDVDSYAGSASGNEAWPAGTGWHLLEHTWVFDSDAGTRDALVVEARLYSTPSTCGECSTDFYIDDVSVDVFGATHPDLSITLPGDVDPPPPPPVCEKPDFTGSFGWEDGVSTILGSFSNVMNPTNVTHPELVNTGDHALRVTEAPHLDTTPEVHVAFIENLNDGDTITARVFGYDDTPGVSPSLRIWANYAQSGDLNSFAGSAGGNLQFTSGTGWEEIEHTWAFDSDGGTRDALMIQVRLYSDQPECAECSTDYYIDDVSVDVCSSSPGVNIIFPTPEPDLGEPNLQGEYGWEDGIGTMMGFFSPFGTCFGEPWAGNNLSADNVGSPNPVNTGERSLRLTEEPHCNSTPRAYVAFIENLQDGDVIEAGFSGFDNVFNSPPRMRIWGSYGFSGNVDSFAGSADGNPLYTFGTGWHEISHTWVFDSGTQAPPRDALKIEVRLYSDEPDCPTCSTDYYVDDVWVKIWSSHNNATITFPFGDPIGDPDQVPCIADVIGDQQIGFFDQITVLNAWGSTEDPDSDVNSDGIVDGGDLGIILASYGSCEDFLLPAFGPVSVNVTSQPAGPGLTEYQLFVPLNDPDDALVSVYNANITSSTGFETGSTVTIGSLPQPGDVQEDPNFDFTEFDTGTTLGADAGWYNSNPGNNVGLAGSYPNNEVLIASFIVDESAELSGTLSLAYRNAAGRAIYGTANVEVDTDSCPGDLNGDDTVNVSDLLLLLGNFGACPGCPADLNGDDTVNVSDLLLLLGNFGACP